MKQIMITEEQTMRMRMLRRQAWECSLLVMRIQVGIDHWILTTSSEQIQDQKYEPKTTIANKQDKQVFSFRFISCWNVSLNCSRNLGLLKVYN